MAGKITSSKAAILETLNAPLVVDNIELPEHLEKGQVLVRVHCSGICGTQLEEITAIEDSHLPHLLGHEGGGIVENVGPGVTHVKEGDHVVMHWRKGAGIEAKFPKYFWPKDKEKGTYIGGGRVTTFNEWAIVSENRLTPIDKNIPLDIAALMGCAVTTGLGAVLNDAKLRPGESIAVVGCGGVGLCAIQAAAMVSAYPIIAVDMLESKLEMAKAYGATHTINDMMRNRLTELNHVDVAIECTGAEYLIQDAFEAVAPEGRMVLVGLPQDPKSTTMRLRDARQHFSGKKIIFSEGGRTDPGRDIPRYLKLYLKSRLALDSLITHRYPLDYVNKALDQVRTGMCGRCMLEMP